MPKPFLLDSFEKHKQLGLAAFKKGDVPEARYHFLKSAGYLMELAQQSEDPLRTIRIKQARKLVELAKTLQARRKAARENAAASRRGDDDAAVPEDWLVAEK